MFRTGSRCPALAVVTVAAIALAGCGSSSNGAASVAAVSSVSPAAGRFQMDPVAKAFVDAWNDRDATAMVNLFPADGVLVDDTRTFRGHQEVRSFAEPEVTGYTIKVLSVEERRADGQKILVEVNRNSGGGFRASFDFTIADGRIPRESAVRLIGSRCRFRHASILSLCPGPGAEWIRGWSTPRSWNRRRGRSPSPVESGLADDAARYGERDEGVPCPMSGSWSTRSVAP